MKPYNIKGAAMPLYAILVQVTINMAQVKVHKTLMSAIIAPSNAYHIYTSWRQFSSAFSPSSKF